MDIIKKVYIGWLPFIALALAYSAFAKGEMWWISLLLVLSVGIVAGASKSIVKTRRRVFILINGLLPHFLCWFVASMLFGDLVWYKSMIAVGFFFIALIPVTIIPILIMSYLIKPCEDI